MKAVGIDSVDIKRFDEWTNFSKKKLSRVFSVQELEYCFSEKEKAVERLAVRFAAKEALYKALSSCHEKQVAFLTLCSHCSVERTQTGAPHFVITWEKLAYEPMTIYVTVTHTQTVATAVVLLT